MEKTTGISTYRLPEGREHNQVRIWDFVRARSGRWGGDHRINVIAPPYKCIKAGLAVQCIN